MRSTFSRGLALAALFPLFSCLNAWAVPERASLDGADAFARLTANAGGAVFLSSAQKDAYTMLQATGSQPLMADGGSGAPLARAQLFLSVYGAALGISDPLTQLSLRRISTDQKGYLHVHLGQVHDGLPVYGARVIVHMDDAGIVGVNGVFVRELPPVALAVPRSLTDLHRIAELEAAKSHPASVLETVGGSWVIYPEGLLRGELGESRLAYEAIVASQGGKLVRERVLVDGVNGRVLDRINDIHAFLNREIYTPDQTVPPNLDESPVTPTPAGQADPPLINDPGHNATTASNAAPGQPSQNLWVFAGGTYALYKNMFDRKGYDACDPNGGPCQPDVAGPVWSPVRGNSYVGQIQKSVYLVNQACPNAYWNGDSTNYCPGFDADDVVSHEWSHAYTQYTHGLIYAYQSGALNESYSDIFGESYDLMNNIEGPLGGATLTEHKYYEEGGSRWVVGEDLSEEAAALLLRDMWKPDDFPAANPGKATSANYTCGSGDGGGVHANSSVPNHAYAMLVDGTKGQGPPVSTGAARDTFNGQSFMPGIGIVKAAHIYYYAENNYQTPTTDFPQHANALRQSCQALKGVNLKGPDGLASGKIIDQADCDKLEQAMLATEMDLGSPCPYIPVLKQNPPAACIGPTNFFQEDWESGGAGWTKNDSGRFSEWNDSTHDVRQWKLKSSSLPENHTGTAAFAINPPIGQPGGGTCQPGGDYSGEFNYDSPPFTVPAGASQIELRFDHYVNTEATADGGQLEINVNDGGFKLVAQSNYKYNPPNSALLGAADTSNNPNGGEFAWNGADINAPSGSPPTRWGTTVVNLAALAKPGDKVQLRFKFTQEGCNGRDGWYVDNIRAFSCASLPPPVLSVGSDYENPDTNGSFTLNWTHPGNATGPDLLQKSTTSCAPLLIDDAEGGLGKWVATTQGSNATAWAPSGTKKHAGANAFFASYTNGSDAAATGNKPAAILTLKNAVMVPLQGSTTLSYWDFYMNEGDDTVFVELSKDGGTSWQVLSQGNRSELAPNAAPIVASEPLTQRTIALDAFKGDSIKIRFRMQSGGEDRAGSSPFGWYVDDISIDNDNWGDVLTTSATSATLSNQLDGARCYRVRTAYPVGGDLVSSQFSNIVKVTVQAGLTNLPPVANAGLDQSVAVGSHVVLDSSASVEPNGDPLMYTWTQTSGEPVTLTDASSSRPSFTAPGTATTLAFQLTVQDPSAAQSTDTVQVEVTGSAVGNNRLAGALPAASLLLLGLLGLLRSATSAAFRARSRKNILGHDPGGASRSS